MSGHMRGDARKRSLESQHRLKIEQGQIVSCMCGAATNTDPYGDAVTTHIIAEARADGANAVLAAVMKEAPRLNMELRYDGTEDPQAAAYVEGYKDAWTAADSAAGGVR